LSCGTRSFSLLAPMIGVVGTVHVFPRSAPHATGSPTRQHGRGRSVPQHCHRPARRGHLVR
jgi:hypothetical protein